MRGLLVADLSEKLETLTAEHLTLRKVTDKMQMEHREMGLKVRKSLTM